MPSIPSIPFVLLDPISFVHTDSFVQIHHDIDTDDQAFLDAFDHIDNSVHDHAASNVHDHAAPVMHAAAPRKSSRVPKPPSYLKAYHCNQISAASISNLSHSGTSHPLSSYLSYTNLSPSYKSYCCSICTNTETKSFS